MRPRRIWHQIVWTVLWLCTVMAGGVPATATYPTWQQETLYVQDTVEALSPEVRTTLNANGLKLQQATGAEAVIVVVADTAGESVTEYATGLFRAWGIGQADKNNGVLLLIVPSTHEVRIEVGYGLEGALNDAKVGALLDREFVPYARKGDLNTAAERTYRALCTEVAHEYGIDTAEMYGTEPLQTDSWSDDPLTVAFICVVMWLMLFRSGGRGGRGGRGNGRGGSSWSVGGRGGFGGGSSGGGGAGRSW